MASLCYTAITHRNAKGVGKKGNHLPKKRKKEEITARVSLGSSQPKSNLSSQSEISETIYPTTTNSQGNLPESFIVPPSSAATPFLTQSTPTIVPFITPLTPAIAPSQPSFLTTGQSSMTVNANTTSGNIQFASPLQPLYQSPPQGIYQDPQFQSPHVGWHNSEFRLHFLSGNISVQHTNLVKVLSHLLIYMYVSSIRNGGHSPHQ